MKTLYPAQQEALNFFRNAQRKDLPTLDTSDLGTGKTVVASQLAAAERRPVFVICPKASIPNWERELADVGLRALAVTNYESIRTGRSPWVSRKGKVFTWKDTVPGNTLFFVDEIHRAKGPFTLNAQLVLSIIMAGYAFHGMSATAAESPVDMRVLGYMLNEHGLHKSGGVSGKSWWGWMGEHGCYQDPWHHWRFNNAKFFLPIHRRIYKTQTFRVRIADLPEGFKNNRVIIEPVRFQALKKIQKAYEEAGITPQVVSDLLEYGTVTDSVHVLVNLLRARQLAESFKLPDVLAMAQDLIEEGYSPVIFQNFRESVGFLSDQLDAGVIQGGQTTDERQKVIDDFAEDKIHCVVANTQAGGVSVNLHDVRGERPRVALISPTFNAKDYAQCLGRIYRNGAKSDSIQKVLVAEGTIEEQVMKSLDAKVRNIHSFNEGVLV